jgi:hypothetical protein
LRNFRNHLPYETDDSEAEEMKTLIMYYKKSVNNAKCALEEDTVAVHLQLRLTRHLLWFTHLLLELTCQLVWFCH